MMLWIIVLVVALAQAPGRGVSKDTRACSAGIIDDVYNFMMKYFPVEEADDDCLERKCTCGSEARVSLLTNTSRSEVERRRKPAGKLRRKQFGESSDIQGFGLHCVYAAGKGGARATQSGSMSQEELENIISGKLGSMSTYDVFMEYNTGLYTSDISSFVAALDSDSVEYYTINWGTKDGNFLSVLVHPPESTIVHEVIGPASSAPHGLLKRAVKQTGTRFSFNYLGGLKGAPPTSTGTMSALWVSRASTNITRDEIYFKDIFGLSDTNFEKSFGTDPLGNSYDQVEIQMSDMASTKYRLVQPADTSSGTYSVGWWESYNNAVHDQYMTSPTCGWDILGDNHNAFDWTTGGFDQRTIMANMASAGYPYFCKDAGSGQTHCYCYTPFGYQIQLDGTYSSPPTYYSYPSQLCATYLEYC